MHQTEDVLIFRPAVTDYDPRGRSIKKEMEDFNQQAIERLAQSLVWKTNINNDVFVCFPVVTTHCGCIFTAP